MNVVHVNLLAGWLGMLGGVLSGSVIGLYFHRQDWMGGYGSLRRRMTRLGHIAFFGLGFVNLLFAVSARLVDIPPLEARLASVCFVLGLVAMPLCCFLTAWRAAFRHAFPVPVAAVLVGVVAVLHALASS